MLPNENYPPIKTELMRLIANITVDPTTHNRLIVNQSNEGSHDFFNILMESIAKATRNSVLTPSLNSVESLSILIQLAVFGCLGSRRRTYGGSSKQRKLTRI